MKQSQSPFSVRVLESASPKQTTSSVNLHTLLPATVRTGPRRDNVVEPRLDATFLQDELCPNRLNDVQDWLWVCGRPMPPRPLHHQVLLSREIAITEDIELHLVWHKNRIFLKPIPRYLLEPTFWTDHLSQVGAPINREQSLEACARGLLFSYTSLVAYESDFRIAQARGLLPESLDWQDWRTLTSQVLENHCYASVNPRYWYGELRLSRLNKVYKIRKGSLFRGYSSVGAYAAYEDLLQDNFATLAGILGYVVIALTAMQVGLATNRLQPNTTFQQVSYGFTVFSIIAPLIAVAAIVGFVLAMFVANWRETKNYERRRFREMGLDASWRGPPDNERTVKEQL